MLATVRSRRTEASSPLCSSLMHAVSSACAFCGATGPFRWGKKGKNSPRVPRQRERSKLNAQPAWRSCQPNQTNTAAPPVQCPGTLQLALALSQFHTRLFLPLPTPNAPSFPHVACISLSHSLSPSPSLSLARHLFTRRGLPPSPVPFTSCIPSPFGHLQLSPLQRPSSPFDLCRTFLSI